MAKDRFARCASFLTRRGSLLRAVPALSFSAEPMDDPRAPVSDGPLSADEACMRHIRNMNTARHRSLAIAVALITLPGCRAVGDIFKAGMWVAVIGIGLLALLGYGIASLFRR